MAKECSQANSSQLAGGLSSQLLNNLRLKDHKFKVSLVYTESAQGQSG